METKGYGAMKMEIMLNDDLIDPIAVEWEAMEPIGSEIIIDSYCSDHQILAYYKSPKKYHLHPEQIKDVEKEVKLRHLKI